MKRGGTVRNVRLCSLKCLTTNVTRAEKNALKHQIDKTRGNMSCICLWLDILKQDESQVSIQDGDTTDFSDSDLKKPLFRDLVFIFLVIGSLSKIGAKNKQK